MTSQQDQTKVELIGKDIGYIQKDIAEIKSSVKELAGVYATKIQMDNADSQLKDRIRKLEQSGHMWRWLSPLIGAVLGSVITFLLVNYLQNAR